MITKIFLIENKAGFMTRRHNEIVVSKTVEIGQRKEELVVGMYGYLFVLTCLFVATGCAGVAFFPRKYHMSIEKQGMEC